MKIGLLPASQPASQPCREGRWRDKDARGLKERENTKNEARERSKAYLSTQQAYLAAWIALGLLVYRRSLGWLAGSFSDCQLLCLPIQPPALQLILSYITVVVGPKL